MNSNRTMVPFAAKGLTYSLFILAGKQGQSIARIYPSGQRPPRDPNWTPSGTFTDAADAVAEATRRGVSAYNIEAF